MSDSFRKHFVCFCGVEDRGQAKHMLEVHGIELHGNNFVVRNADLLAETGGSIGRDLFAVPENASLTTLFAEAPGLEEAIGAVNVEVVDKPVDEDAVVKNPDGAAAEIEEKIVLETVVVEKKQKATRKRTRK